jgi:hypothetical protein
MSVDEMLAVMDQAKEEIIALRTARDALLGAVRKAKMVLCGMHDFMTGEHDTAPPDHVIEAALSDIDAALAKAEGR